jgi:prepilin-type N-terminal cleavage/methylation domain-containing protein
VLQVNKGDNYYMKATRGFTLIELLIVIALLGALAVGLLAAIDPFEQLKKGRDTSTRNTLSEFYNANLRYYSIRSGMPWGTGAISTALGNLPNVVNALQDAGELKANFMALAQQATGAVYLSSTGGGDIHVCFNPESRGFDIDPNTIYDLTGGSSFTNCKSMGTGSGFANANCYYCIQ